MTRTDTVSLRIRLLGRFQVYVEGRAVEVDRWPRPKAQQLLKLLALTPQHRLHREQLMEFLWPESSLARAANNLNKALHMARRALEPDLAAGQDPRFLRRESDQVALVSPDELRIDVETFEEQASLAAKTGDAADCEAALALYAGDLLTEDLYEEWLWSRRDQLG